MRIGLVIQTVDKWRQACNNQRPNGNVHAIDDGRSLHNKKIKKHSANKVFLICILICNASVFMGIEYLHGLLTQTCNIEKHIETDH